MQQKAPIFRKYDRQQGKLNFTIGMGTWNTLEIVAGMNMRFVTDPAT